MKEVTPAYTTERYTAEIDAKTYFGRYRKADHFIKPCRQCGNYGRRYVCPPFDYDPLPVIEGYNNVRIVGVRIVSKDKSLPLDAAVELMKPVIDELDRELRESEKTLGGRSFGFLGTCPYCGDTPCARISGEPCKHPDKVRPSLEAFGFDVSKTARNLLGIEMNWSKGGLIPEYLTLVCGMFYWKGADKGK